MAVHGWVRLSISPAAEWTISWGETAERVAKIYGIGRREQEEFALESQRRALAAAAAGAFADEIAPLEVPAARGSRTIAADESPRAGLSLEALAKLEPAFVREGTVTAATSSGINDGAAALSVASTRTLADLGLSRWPSGVATGGAVSIRAAWDSAHSRHPKRSPEPA